MGHRVSNGLIPGPILLSATSSRWPAGVKELDLDVAQGRDQRQRKVVAGRLMPFGHKAIITATMTRRFETGGTRVAGLVTFRRSGDQLSARVQLTGLPANSEHGFHIHEKADCTAPDGSSAGGHFNPSAMPHGPQGGARHAGDMPNLRADAQGRVDTTLMVGGVTAGGGAANDIVGRSLIVHAAPDDYRTQPTGNSGARLACGLIIDR